MPALLFRLSLIVLFLTLQPPAAGQPAYDLVIQNGTVVDGSGAPRFRADVAVTGDRIVLVSRAGIAASRAASVFDASGLTVAPGFVDNHAHIETSIRDYPLAENFLRQGITTILASLHSKDQPWPLDEFTAALEMAPNVGFFAGHTWTRKQVVGMENREPTPEELDKMRWMVEESMKAGALGLSTGLLYVPANYARTEEVIELARVAARHGGIYVSHMRNESTGVLESVAEVIRIAEEAGIPAQIQHHKVVGASQFGKSNQTLAMIDEARARGLDIKLDLYPYTASSTTSAILFPQWALAGGQEQLVARLDDPATRARIETEMRPIMKEERAGEDLSNIQFRVVPSDRSLDGKTLADLASRRGLEASLENGIQLVIELQKKGGFSAIYHSMDDEDVKRIMRHPFAMFDTDGDSVGYGVGYPHPRSYGTFPRILGRYVRELKVLSLEEAIYKMSWLATRQIGQLQRGRIAEGMMADITIFDFEQIRDLATFTAPHQYSLGVHHVLVNGVPVIRDGALTGAKPGKVLKGPARQTNRPIDQ